MTAPRPDAEVVDQLGLTRTGRRRRRWGLLAVAVVAVVVLVVAVVVWTSGRRSRWVYDTAEVSRITLDITVTAVGTLEPVNTVDVSSELSGIVAEVLVDANDIVERGQVLARLDTSMLRAQADQSRASVRASAASLAQARITVESTLADQGRAETLAPAGAVSRVELDNARNTHRRAVAAVALAEAQLEQARASLAAAETNLSRATIVAPIDGVVLDRNVEPGQAVVSAMQAATMFRVAESLHRMGVDVEVDEADIGRVIVGQAATFTVSAYPDRVFEAVVDKVHLAPKAGQQVVAYEATLLLDNEDQALFPGMTATATILAERLDDAVVVPNTALRFTPPDAGDLPPPEPRDDRRVARVWTLYGEDPTPVEVLPIATDGVNTAVEGVEPGLVLVTAARPRREARQ